MPIPQHHRLPGIVPERFRALRWISLLSAGLLACTTSWAARPLVTEDAGVSAGGECELEYGAGRQRRPDISFRSVQVGCGIGRQTQFALAMSRETAGGERSHYLTASGKTSLGTPDEDRPALALAYTLLGGREQADYLNYVSAELKGVLTLPYRGWLLHANAGLLRLHRERDNRVLWAVAAERAVLSGTLDLMAEVYGDNRDDPWIQFGARWSAVPGRVVIDAAYGIQGTGRQARVATLGMTLAF